MPTTPPASEVVVTLRLFTTPMLIAFGVALLPVQFAAVLPITPLLARVGHDVSRRIELRQPGADTTDDDAPRTIVIGFGRVGRMVADMLDVHTRPWIALEADPDDAASARRDGRPVRFGDAGRMETLEHLGLATASAIVFTMDDPVQVLRLTRRLRDRFPDLTIIARARDTHHAAALYRAGVSDAVPETLESSLQLSEAVLVDLGVAMGPVIASIHEKRDELRAAIKENGGLATAPKLKSV